MPGRRSFHPSAAAVVAVALGVLAVVSVAWTLTRDTSPAATADDARVSQWLATHTPETEAPAKSVVYIGDSYAAGTGASKGHGWTDRLTSSEGWAAENVAQGGTGYLTTSGQAGCGRPVCPNYQQVLREIQTAKPDTIIVSGGRNDVAQPRAAEAAAVTAFFRSLRAQFPDADILAVSPIWDDDPAPAELQHIQADVQTAVTTAGGDYVDIGEPLKGHPDFVIEDGVHPNDAGHEAIYRAVTGALPEGN